MNILILILALLGAFGTGGYGLGNGAHISLGTLLIIIILLVR